MGSHSDNTDIAIAELPSKFIERLKGGYTPADLNLLEYDRLVPLPEPMVVMGFPLSRNKISRTTRRVRTLLSIQQGMHVATDDEAFHSLRVGYNLVVRLNAGQLVPFPPGPRGGPHPIGMSGGPIWTVDAPSFFMRSEIRFRGIIGIAFQYHENYRCIFGTHINVVLRKISEGWPHLSAELPDLDCVAFRSTLDT